MNTILNFNKKTTAILVLAIVLITYGYICRYLEIFFFWGSRSIGWFLFFIAIIFFLKNRIKANKSINKKSMVEKISIGILSLILLIKIILWVSISVSDAYNVVKERLSNDSLLINETGLINDISIIPSGGIQVGSDSNGEYGSATINLTIKGAKKYKDVTFYLEKNPKTTKWEIISME